jgi:hypothetical protein
MTTSIHRWTTTVDKGNLRCRTWGGGHRRRTVTVRGVTRAGGRPVRSVKRCLTLTSGPWFHYSFNDFQSSEFEIQKSDLSDVQNLPKFAG